jgi:hypothetical protein
MNIRKVNAFTIMELTVTMLITTVIVAIAFTAFGLVQRYESVFIHKNEDISSFLLLDRLTREDFRRSHFVLASDSGLLFKYDNKIVKLIIGPQSVIRIANRIDTFSVNATNVKLALHNQTVSGSDASSGILIDELTFTSLYKNEVIDWYYHKDYSAEQLLDSTYLKPF